MKAKKLLSGIMAFTLAITTYATPLGNKLFNTSIVASANTDGSTAGDTGGSGGGGIVPTGNNTSALLIYFAKRSDVFDSNNGLIVSNIKDDLSALHTYAKYGYVGVSGDAASRVNSGSDFYVPYDTIKQSYTNSSGGTSTAYGIQRKKNSSGSWHNCRSKIPSGMIVSKDSDNYDFSSCFDSGDTVDVLPNFNTITWNSSKWNSTFDGSSLSDWANTTFKSDDNIKHFVEHWYASASSAWGSSLPAALPKNYAEFASQWLIVVEPMTVYKQQSSAASVTGFAYQDLEQATDVTYSFQTTNYWWMVNESNHTHNLRKFWPKYIKDGGAESNYDGTSKVGFGFYWGGLHLWGQEVRATANYTLRNDSTNYKYNSIKATSHTGVKLDTLYASTVSTVADKNINLGIFSDKNKMAWNTLKDTAYDLTVKQNSSNTVTAPIYHSLGKTNDLWSGVTYKDAAKPSNNKQGFQFNTGFSPKGSSDNTTNYKTPAGKNITAFAGDALASDDYFLVSTDVMKYQFGNSSKGKTYNGSKKYADIMAAFTNSVSELNNTFVTVPKAMSLSGASSSNVYNFGTSFTADLYRANSVSTYGTADTTNTKRAGLGGGNLEGTGTGQKRNGVSTALLASVKTKLGDNNIEHSGYMADGTEDIGVLFDNNGINNVIGNTNAAARDVGIVKVNNKNDYSLVGQDNVVGISLNYLAKDKKVTSYIRVYEKDENGNITDKTSAYVGATEATYSMRSSGSFTINRPDANGTAFVVLVPNNQPVVSNGHSLSNSAGQDYYKNLLATYQCNSFDGAKTLVAKVTNDLKAAYLGDNGSASLAGQKLLYFLPEGVTSNTIGVGAVGGTWVNDNTASADKDITGYNLVVLIDKTKVAPQEVWADVPAYRVNQIYPNILGNSTLTKQKEGKAARFISVSKSLTSGNISSLTVTKHTTDYKGLVLDKQKALVNASKKPIVFYNTISYTSGKYVNGRFNVESVNPKTWSLADYTAIANNGEYVTLTHAFDLNKNLFGDKLTASALNDTNEYIVSNATVGSVWKSYLSDSLAVNFGMTASGSRASGTASTTTQIGGERKDYWFWSANKAVYTLPSGAQHHFSPFYYGEDADKAGYNMHELAYKYTPSNKSKGTVTENTTPVTYNSGLNYTLTAVKKLNDVQFYPDIAMKVDLPLSDVSNGKFSSAQTCDLYVLGEKLRTAETAGMYTMRLVDKLGNSAKSGATVDTSDLYSGTTQSASVATGSDAKALGNEFKSLVGNNPLVIYAGADVQSTITSDMGIEYYGFVLDMADASIDSKIHTGNTTVTGSAFLQGIDGTHDLHDEWNGGVTSTGKTNFENWVKNVKSHMYISPELHTMDAHKNNEKIYTFGTDKLYTGSTANANAVWADSFNIKVANGAVVQDGAFKALMTEMARVYSCSEAEAAAKFENSGLYKSLIASIETSQNTNAESVAAYGGKWYDEKVNYFVVREYKSESNVLPGKGNSKVINAKLDITSGPAQSSDGKLFQNGYAALWEVTLGFDDSSIFGGGFTYDGKDVKDKNKGVNSGSIVLTDISVKGAGFVIPDATTADMYK